MQYVVRFLSSIIDWLAGLTGSYGLAVIGLTVAFRLVLLPLSIMQARSLQMVNLIKPEEDKIRKKYKNDPERLQMELMDLYGRYKVNPASSCIGLAVQMPLLMAMIQALGFNESLKGATFLGLTLGAPGGWVMAVVAGLTTYLSFKFSPTMGAGPQGQSQTVMVIFMVGLMLYLGWKYAAGVSLYIITANLMGLLEKYVVPQPQLTPEGARPSEKR
ncbi:MAG: YidC/Oxa1 family membrane protein insertase [Bacillota bacterium]|jgi:YidC/Oxa1 family membrane protein insertase|nr:membrane protein insertase YidC [Candidatus Fermentithermobacillaceae bacterium]